MTKRFCVIVGGTTSEQNDVITNFLKQSFSWWHWIDNVWLLTTSVDDVTPGSIRTTIKNLLEGTKGLKILVLEVPGPRTWAGFGPSTEKRNMFKWIHDNWDE